MKSRLPVVPFVCLAFACLAGCLDFGDDVDLVAPEVTAAHLQQVTALTGIQFPQGSTGLGYLYFGSGIDDKLAVKILIPSDKKEAFLENEIFQKGRNDSPDVQIGESKEWWKIDSLSDRIDRTLELSPTRYVECTLGSEDGDLVVYVSWITG